MPAPPTTFDTVVGARSTRRHGHGGEVETEACSMFADVSYDLTDAVGGIAGRPLDRATSATATSTARTSPASVHRSSATTRPPRAGALERLRGDRTYDEFSPRVSVSYSFTDDVTAYAGYSEGFKAGSFDMRGANVADARNREGIRTRVRRFLRGRRSSPPARRSARASTRPCSTPSTRTSRSRGQEPTVTGVNRQLRRQRRRVDDPGRRGRGAIRFTDRLRRPTASATRMRSSTNTTRSSS